MEYFRTLITGFFLLLVIILIACNLEFGHVINDQLGTENLDSEEITDSEGGKFDFQLASGTKNKDSFSGIRLASFKSSELTNSYDETNKESGQICDDDGNEIAAMTNPSNKSTQSFDFMEFPGQGF